MAAKKNPYETERGNYILRSVKRDELINVMALIVAGRVRGPIHGLAGIHREDGTWVGTCEWAIERLKVRGLVRSVDDDQCVRHYFLTRRGFDALDGALAALGRQIDFYGLVNSLDEAIIH